MSAQRRKRAVKVNVDTSIPSRADDEFQKQVFLALLAKHGVRIEFLQRDTVSLQMQAKLIAETYHGKQQVNGD